MEKESKEVTELQRELERLSADYGKHLGVDYSRPAGTNCHRRERDRTELTAPIKDILALLRDSVVI